MQLMALFYFTIPYHTIPYGAMKLMALFYFWHNGDQARQNENAARSLCGAVLQCFWPHFHYRSVPTIADRHACLPRKNEIMAWKFCGW